MPQNQWKLQGDYKPWYVGWANCDNKASDILSQYYQSPYFLPENSKSIKKEWIFMGTPGFGAPFHKDDVKLPSWQAQVIMIADFKMSRNCYFSIHIRLKAKRNGF